MPVYNILKIPLFHAPQQIRGVCKKHFLQLLFHIAFVHFGKKRFQPLNISMFEPSLIKYRPGDQRYELIRMAQSPITELFIASMKPAVFLCRLLNTLMKRYPLAIIQTANSQLKIKVKNDPAGSLILELEPVNTI